MIVVDLGCYDHGGKWPSLPVLAKWYKPERIFGFDPNPHLNVHTRQVEGTPVSLSRRAAWTYNGHITYTEPHLPGRHGPIGVAPQGRGGSFNPGRIGMIGEGPDTVRCFDFSPWLAKHGPAVVKMDIEGSEYGLLQRMIRDGTHTLISTLHIEWHFYEDVDILRALKKAKVKVKTWLY
jgi:FkbM family methyltransferase